jgi:hypothetical protein
LILSLRQVSSSLLADCPALTYLALYGVENKRAAMMAARSGLSVIHVEAGPRLGA